ncbi:hypothetical protein L484_003105 [Morus notabilis]|uniref:Uncharacterized protein n=1 Tax=Morus notabilis TaxID=981085 RepID=W9SCW8_9ROSA|nr:hypothetical protein L484_003105 [Morus notabilis]
MLMGTLQKAKDVAVLVAVVEREESFELTADGTCSDIKSLRRSSSGCRARGDLQTYRGWALFGPHKLSLFS